MNFRKIESLISQFLFTHSRMYAECMNRIPLALKKIFMFFIVKFSVHCKLMLVCCLDFFFTFRLWNTRVLSVRWIRFNNFLFWFLKSETNVFSKFWMKYSSKFLITLERIYFRTRIEKKKLRRFYHIELNHHAKCKFTFRLS